MYEQLRYDASAIRVKFPDNGFLHTHAERCEQAADEIARLSYLHDLDHKLADQWQEDKERLQTEYEALAFMASRCVTPNAGGNYTREEALRDLEVFLRPDRLQTD